MGEEMKKQAVSLQLTRLVDLKLELIPLVDTTDQAEYLLYLLGEYEKLNEWIMAVQSGIPEPKSGLKRSEIHWLRAQCNYYYYPYLLIRELWDKIKDKKFSSFGLTTKPVDTKLTTPADLANFIVAYDFYLEFEVCLTPYYAFNGRGRAELSKVWEDWKRENPLPKKLNKKEIAKELKNIDRQNEPLRKFKVPTIIIANLARKSTNQRIKRAFEEWVSRIYDYLKRIEIRHRNMGSFQWHNGVYKKGTRGGGYKPPNKK